MPSSLLQNRNEHVLSTANSVRRRFEPTAFLTSMDQMVIGARVVHPAQRPLTFELTWNRARPEMLTSLLEHYELAKGESFHYLRKRTTDPATAPVVQYLRPPAISRINARRTQIVVRLVSVPNSMAT